jgi:hypothetical protein
MEKSKGIEKASIEELLGAIQDKGQSLYIGIVDNEGTESLSKVSNFKEFNDSYGLLSLRARFNGHRGPDIFSVVIPPEMYKVYKEQLSNNKRKDVAESIKELSTFKVIG